MDRLRRCLITAAQFVGMLALLAVAMATYDATDSPSNPTAEVVSPAGQLAEGSADLGIGERLQEF